MCAGNDGVERPLDPFAIFFRDGQRGQELDCVIPVSRNLRKQLVIIEQRNYDQLAEQSAARGFQEIPGCSEPRRARRPEFNPDHQPFATNRSDQFVATGHLLKRAQQPFAKLR